MAVFDRNRTVLAIFARKAGDFNLEVDLSGDAPKMVLFLLVSPLELSDKEGALRKDRAFGKPPLVVASTPPWISHKLAPNSPSRRSLSKAVDSRTGDPGDVRVCLLLRRCFPQLKVF